MPRLRQKLDPLDRPAQNPIRKWADDPANTFEDWKKKADKAKTEAERAAMMARAYVCDDGFFHYCHDILGYQQMDDRFHRKMTDFIVGRGIDYYPVQRVRMCLAFRFSFKSSIGGMGWTTWLIAREYILSEPVRKLQEEINALENPDHPDVKKLQQAIQRLIHDGDAMAGVNIRIGIQSESLDLAADTVQSCCEIMDSEIYQQYFGVHGPKDRRKGGRWGKSGATSVYRSNKALRDPTIWTISLEAPRIGRHFDVIIADDLQAERSAASRHMLNQSWRMWKGNFQLLDPPNISPYSEILVVGTRWHTQDIYGRMMDENKEAARRDRTEILELPVCIPSKSSKSGKVATCPTIYRTEDLPSLIAKGIDKFNTQYLLKPIAGATQPFKPEMIRYYRPDTLSKRNRMYAVTGVDFCWVEAARRGDSGADHSVVMTWLVDVDWSFYLIDSWREQADRRTTLEEAKRQYISNESLGLGLSVSDRKHVENDIRHFEYDAAMAFAITWVSDLHGGEGVSADTSKARKIIGTLQPLFQSGKINIPIGINWFEEEILDCPRGATDDGLDATVCAIVTAGAPAMKKRPAPQPMTEGERWKRHTEALLKGKPIYLDGTPVRTGKEPGQRAPRRFRRVRARR